MDLRHGDCREVMATLAENSVDAIVTDPPYGLEFMGKEWDKLWVEHDEGQQGRIDGKGGMATWGKTPQYRGGIVAQRWHESWAREAYRVLKPGGHLLAFSGSRTYHRLACAIEDAGFEIRDQLQWLYGSGFPKSHNLHGEWDGWGTALKPAHEPIVLARKPLIGTVAANVTAHGTGALNIDGCRIGTEGETWSGNAENAHDEYSGKVYGAFGKQYAKPSHALGRWPANVILDAWDERVLRLRYNIPDEVARTIREFYRDYRRVPPMPSADRDLSEPQGPDEVLFSDVLCGVVEREQSRREPSHARQEAHAGIAGADDGEEASDRQERAGKPQLEGRSSHLTGIRDGFSSDAGRGRAGTISRDGNAQQQFGDTGASPSNGADAWSSTFAVGDCASQKRHQDGQPTGEPRNHRQRGPQENTPSHIAGAATAARRERTAVDASLYVLECDVPAGWRDHFDVTSFSVPSPDSAAALLDAQSGERSCGNARQGVSRAQTNGYDGGWGDTRAWTYGDTGGASRFFYCAKASRAERNAGLYGMPERDQGQRYGTVQDARPHTVDGYEYPRTPTANHHPTVKPIALMRWLCRLITPPDGLILDPFLGSGTTGIAAALEGFRFTGIEQDADYLAIAERRIAHWTRKAGYGPLFELAAD